MSANETARRRQPAVFYGWVVVAGAFVVMFLGFGAAYSFTTFFESFQTDFSASRASVSLVFSIGGFLYFTLGAVSGPLADRFGPKFVCAFGMTVVAIGLVLGSRATSLWQIYLAYGVGVGVGVGFSYVPAIGAVQRWFLRRRGMASGIAVSGIGLGTFAVPWLADYLIARQDWRLAYLVLGVVVLVLGIAASQVIENNPERRGLAPDGGPAAPELAADTPALVRAVADLSLAEALGTRPFWLIYAGSAVLSLGLFVPFVHLVPYAIDHGLSRTTGVALFSLIGLGSIAGRFVIGGLADRLGRRRSFVAMYAGLGLMFLWWLVATSRWELTAFAIIYGTCYGGFVALAPAVMSDYFGGRNAGAIIGALYTSVAFGTLAGPPLAGAAFDAWGSYDLPIAAGAGVALLGAGLTALAADPVAWRRARAA